MNIKVLPNKTERVEIHSIYYTGEENADIKIFWDQQITITSTYSRDC